MAKKVGIGNQRFTCSNQECKGTFSKPIAVENLSLKTEYQGCPFCLTKLEENSKKETERRLPKESRAKAGVAKEQLTRTESIQQVSPENGGCQHYFTYLNERSRGEAIPEECVTCEKVIDCMRGT